MKALSRCRARGNLTAPREARFARLQSSFKRQVAPYATPPSTFIMVPVV
jgi:hypothetical protein